jgi:thiopurine S-methyltransferase
LEPDFWRERWATGQTGWHESAPNASLVDHAAVLSLAPGRRVLVPLSGKSVDLTFLASTGAEVVGSELVEEAALAFFTEQGLTPSRTELGSGHVRLSSGKLHVLVGDFFTLEPADVGRIDAVYDRAALVALAPEQRAPYAKRLVGLAPGAPVLSVTFEHDLPDGPPFAVGRDVLAKLFGPVEALGERDVLKPGEGLAARGATFARELATSVRLGR